MRTNTRRHYNGRSGLVIGYEKPPPDGRSVKSFTLIRVVVGRIHGSEAVIDILNRGDFKKSCLAHNESEKSY